MSQRSLWADLWVESAGQWAGSKIRQLRHDHGFKIKTCRMLWRTFIIAADQIDRTVAWSGYDQPLPRSHAWCACTRAQAHPQVDQLVMYNANGSWSTRLPSSYIVILHVCVLWSKDRSLLSSARWNACWHWVWAHSCLGLKKVKQFTATTPGLAAQVCQEHARCCKPLCTNYHKLTQTRLLFLLLHSGATRSLVAPQAENPKGGTRCARVPNPKTAQISKQVAAQVAAACGFSTLKKEKLHAVQAKKTRRSPPRSITLT